MADVIAVWPTVNMEKSDELAKMWKAQGYDTAVIMERPYDFKIVDHAIVEPTWTGFPAAANRLCHAFKHYKVVVMIGDDIHPDPNKTADEILSIFLSLFNGTYGVMQPIGDKYGCYDIACISPWIGQEYIEQRPGPYNTGYYHYYSDAELQDVAIKHGCFQQREDITQYHDHWSRNRMPRPGYLNHALNEHESDKRFYGERRRLGFPES